MFEFLSLSLSLIHTHTPLLPCSDSDAAPLLRGDAATLFLLHFHPRSSTVSRNVHQSHIIVSFINLVRFSVCFSYFLIHKHNARISLFFFSGSHTISLTCFVFRLSREFPWKFLNFIIYLIFLKKSPN